jgi:Ca2+-binding RTX toxin-like protein
LDNSSPDCGCIVGDDELTIVGAFSDIGTLDRHTVLVDWDDGSPVESIGVDQTQDTFIGTHTYETGGIFVVTVTLVDDDTGAHTEVTTAFKSGVRLTDDGQLQIVGSTGKDIVSAKLVGGGSDGGSDGGPDSSVKVTAKLNVGGSDGGKDVYYFDPADIHSVRIVLGEGDDHATLSGGSDGGSDGGPDTWYATSIIEGGAGRDHLTGGDGDDVIFGGTGKDKLKGNRGNDLLLGDSGDDDLDGGDGNDVLSGGDGRDKLKGKDGRDILIGGAGKDDLNGGNDDDLLIGGSTRYDAYVANLQTIMAQWNASADYETRVSNLRTGAGEILQGTGIRLNSSGPDRTVFNDDREEDSLKGDKGRDWFFAEIGNDKLKGRKGNEELNEALYD